MAKILWNNQLIEEDKVVIGFEDRGYQFGDGVYEVIKVYDGNLFTAKEHIDRLYESADKIQLVIPYTKDKLHQMIYELMEENKLENGHVYLQFTRGTCFRQHHFPDPAIDSVLTAYTKETKRPLEDLAQGVKACFVEDIRWLRCDIKSLNLLGNVMAKQEAVGKGCFEAILHRGEIVTEGSSSNMYGIKDGVIYTHPATNLILNGITRQVILDCCKEIGVSVVEEAFTKEQALQMDEFFMSSTSAEVMPIIKIEDTTIGNGEPGEITQKLQKAFEKRIPTSIHA